MLNIPKKNQELLVKQANLKKLETWEYLKDKENDNFKYIKNKFFAHETNDDKAKLLNIWCWAFFTVSEVYPSYVGNPSIDFGLMFDDVVKDILCLWFGVIGLERVDGKLKMCYEPAKNYWNDNWTHKISRLYMDDNEDYYLLVQTYEIWYIKNNLYKLQSASLSKWAEVSLNTIPQTAWMSKIIMTWLEVPALIIIDDNCPSIYEKITSIVYGIDRQVVMNHTQFLQNLESFVLMKEIKWPANLLKQYDEWKSVDFSKIGRIVNGSKDASIEYINNVNSLINDAIKETETYSRRISSITSIPIEFFGIDSNDWAIGQASRTLKQGSFMKKVQYYRDLIDKAIAQFVVIARWKDWEYTYNRPDIFAKSDKEVVEEIAVAREHKLISHLKAIKKYNWYTDEEAKQELEDIQNEADVLPIVNADD